MNVVKINHPGTVMNAAHIEKLKLQPKGIECMKNTKWGGCQCLETIDIGAYGSGKGHKEFTEDATQSYRFVLLWLASGEDKYAIEAVNILKSWSTKCKRFQGSNAPLEIAWGSVMVRSAEILKYKWKEFHAIEDSFNTFINTIMLPNLVSRYNEIRKWKNNWILTIIEALMQIYIYKNDVEKFNFCLTEYLSIRDEFFIGVSGKNTECERDIVHASFQLLSHINICETARHQGLNLYTEKIRKSCEYIASIINGKKPNDMNAIKDPWYMPSNWEYAISYFGEMHMPESVYMLNQKNRRPENATFCWGPGWTHRV